MARTTSAPTSGRSLPVALLQTVYLLLGLLAVSALAGVLLAAFFLPLVSASSAVAKDGVDLFDSYPSELEVEPLNEASRIEAADGSLLATFYTENRIMVPLEEISPHMQHAVIAVEDRRFREHGGIDPKGMIRAFASNTAGGATQGGSTLTQQYVKNALLMDAVQRGDQEDINSATEQSYGRKLREAKLALSLEKQWSKDEILNAYLNVAQFGPSQYGVETGSRHYFSKSAVDLNPGEAALLAGVTNGPNQYDPVFHPEAGEKRRNEVLTDMRRDGYITDEEHEEYSSQPVGEMLKIQNVRAGCADAGTSGFFCDYVTRSLLNDPTFAPTYEERRKLLYGGGLTIRTTLDPQTQAAATEVLQRKVPGDAQHGFGHSIVTVEPGTGNILTMAENRSFNPHQEVQPGETAINYNVPQALGGGSGFPVGSTFKPFVLQQWLESDRSIYDRVSTAREPITYAPAKCLGGGAWRETPGWNPDNAVSVRIAPMETVLNSTKFSINTSFTDMSSQLDLCEIADSARNIGVVPATYNPYDPTTWEMPIEDMYGTGLAPAALVLGELNISALDMAGAYATWAAGGTYCKPQAITEVIDRNGDAMEISGAECHQAVEKEIADEHGLGAPAGPRGSEGDRSAARSSTATPRAARPVPRVASSTPGTSASPARCPRPCGSATRRATCVRAASTSTARCSAAAASGATPISLPTWQEYMNRAHEGLPSEPFPAAPKPSSSPAGEHVQQGVVPDVSGMVLSRGAGHGRGRRVPGRGAQRAQLRCRSVVRDRHRSGARHPPARERDRGHPPVLRRGLRCR